MLFFLQEESSYDKIEHIYRMGRGKKMNQKKNIAFHLLAIVCIVLFCLAITPITLQNDTYYTIKIGEYIAQNGIANLANGTDPFSWHEGLPYTFPHWLYDFGIYKIYQAGGFDGIYISTLVLSCILGVAVYFVNERLSKNKVLSFLMTIRCHVFHETIYCSKGSIGYFYASYFSNLYD